MYDIAMGSPHTPQEEHAYKPYVGDRFGNSTTQVLQRVLGPQVSWGRLTFVTPDHDIVDIGDLESVVRAKVFIHDPGLLRRIAKGGSVALGESYVDGGWEVEGEDLVTFFRVIFANKLDKRMPGSLPQRLANLVRSVSQSPTTAQKAQLDVRRHYDLGNDFFALMLDPTMAYSCGYALTSEDSLAAMQQQKYARICRKLGLERGGSLLDIGCGWGGFLAYVAEHYPGVRALGITLSNEQLNVARERVRAVAPGGRVEVAMCDYRDLDGRYDFVVSIGMFEHVGRSQYGAFFRKTHGLLLPHGVSLLHTIGMEEPLWRTQDPWMDTYIFPGSRLPRIEELAREARVSDLAIGHVENLRPHYAMTLRHWRRNFSENWQRIRQLDARFDERFRRLWTYYLQICEACFIDSTVELYQVLMCRREGWGFPLNFRFDASPC
jgi:cyclopropane-fatty-acyl-phospholipid synthase